MSCSARWLPAAVVGFGLLLPACTPFGTAACRARMDAREGCWRGDDTPKPAWHERYADCRTATVDDAVHECLESYYRTDPCADCVAGWGPEVACPGPEWSDEGALCDCGDSDAFSQGLDCFDEAGDDDSAW